MRDMEEPVRRRRCYSCGRAMPGGPRRGLWLCAECEGPPPAATSHAGHDSDYWFARRVEEALEDKRRRETDSAWW